MLSKQPGLFFTTLVVIFISLSLYLLYSNGTLEQAAFKIYLEAIGSGYENAVFVDIDKFLNSENLTLDKFVAEGVGEKSSAEEIRQHAVVSEKVAETGPLIIGANCASQPVSVLLSVGEKLMAENRDKVGHLLVVGGDRFELKPESKEELSGTFNLAPASVPYYCDGEKKGVVVVKKL